MGCGCKNKGNQTTQQTQQQPLAQNTTTKVTKVNEDIQTTIKRTVEKYYSKGTK